jgi:hypothetical protein
MERVWQEMRAGWREARWSTSFTLIALPGTLAAVWLSAIIQGKVTDPPTALTWTLVGFVLLAALGWAGLRDGPDGFLGHFVWRVAALGLILWALWRVRQSEGRPQLFVIRVAGYQLMVSVRPVETPQEAPHDLLNLRDLRVNYEPLVKV